MELICNHTGSKGNNYILNIDKDVVILDAGVKPLKMGINLNSVSFAFITHNHKDHSLYMQELKDRGLEVIEGRNYHSYSKLVLNNVKSSNLRAFALPVKHGTEDNSALVIMTDKEKVLYATDFIGTKDIDLSSIKFTSIIVECNYNEEIIEPLLETPMAPKYIRQVSTHMGLEGLMIFLDKLDLSECECIILVHCSDSAGDRVEQATTINKRYKIKVGVCRTEGGIDYYG